MKSRTREASRQTTPGLPGVVAFRGCLSAFADAHGQRKEWQLSGSQLSPRLLQGRTAAFPAAGWQDPTFCRRSQETGAAIRRQSKRIESGHRHDGTETMDQAGWASAPSAVTPYSTTNTAGHERRRIFWPQRVPPLRSSLIRLGITTWLFRLITSVNRWRSTGHRPSAG